MDYNVDNIESKGEINPTMNTDIILHEDGKFQRAKIFGFDGKIKPAFVDSVINQTVTNINNTYTFDPNQIAPSEALYNDTPETLAGDVLKRVDKITGEDVNYREVVLWHDGTAMTDAKADGVIYIKKGTKYYKRQYTGRAHIKWFGDIGVGTNDNTTFNKAVAVGVPLEGLDPVYKLANVQITTTADILFGENTKIINTQTSGTKVPSINFKGSGLQGTAVAVTGIGTVGADSAYHTRTLFVADSSQFAVGNSVLLTENEALKEEVNYPIIPKLKQDFNYREFGTIASISGNQIVFEEFFRFPYSVARSLTLQKVIFLENCHIKGGIYEGALPSGGGVSFSYCRYSSAKNITGRGVSDASRNGGSPLLFFNCWECYSENTEAKWTLFTHISDGCQASQFVNMRGKRTSNGGVMSSGDRFCHIGPINEDSPGTTNGDGLSLSNGSRGNTYGPYTISGANCYTLWLHESCDDNNFLALNSTAGITGGAYVFGNNNVFSDLKIKGHPSFGLTLLGNNNRANVDIEVSGSAVVLYGGSTGNIVRGRAVSKGTGSDSYDVSLSNVTHSIIDLIGGSRGVNVSGTYAASLNYTNDINVRGVNPFSLGKVNVGLTGFVFSEILTGVRDTIAKPILEPKSTGGDTNGLGAYIFTL